MAVKRARVNEEDYIHYNPVKRGYVDERVHWRYSRARNYASEQGMIEIYQIW
jgi:hypothetical protein